MDSVTCCRSSIFWSSYSWAKVRPMLLTAFTEYLRITRHLISMPNSSTTELVIESFVFPSVCVSLLVFLSICLSVSISESVNLSMCLSFGLSAFVWSVYVPSVCQFVYLPVNLSMCLCLTDSHSCAVCVIVSLHGPLCFTVFCLCLLTCTEMISHRWDYNETETISPVCLSVCVAVSLTSYFASSLFK